MQKYVKGGSLPPPQNQDRAHPGHQILNTREIYYPGRARGAAKVAAAAATTAKEGARESERVLLHGWVKGRAGVGSLC